MLEVLWTKSETRETHEPLKLNKDDDALNDGDTRREQTLKSELVGLTHRLEERHERRRESKEGSHAWTWGNG